VQELVSIITPAFQAEAFISRTVGSVIAQTYPEWEMLIVSDDGVDYESLLRQKGICDARLRFFHTQIPKSGPNRARNIALDAARGAWIAPLDADDFYLPWRLEKLLSVANETGLALDNGYVMQISNDSPIVKIFADLPDGRFTFNHFHQVHVPLIFLFHRCLISHGWDPDIDRGADTIFNLRALEAAGYARYIARPLHEYNVHKHSICHSHDAAIRFDLAYQHTINRITEDGLGFRSATFRNRVLDLIENKRILNSKFDTAQSEGYRGNYQNFLSDFGLR